ncbi:MAG TPA: ATP-binding protein [Anaerolineae bacterium]|nr:ATP-binding protein [Anaerolineae bacterium]
MATMNLYADLPQLGAIREFVAQAGRELNVEECVVPDLQLAVEEICANSIQHGYNGQGGPIEVTVEAVEGGIQITVKDWGISFDPQAVPIPDVEAPLEQRPLGGLGLFLVRKLMDEVRFEFDGVRGNSVVMMKQCSKKGGKQWK